MAQGFNAHGHLVHHTLDERLIVNEAIQVFRDHGVRSHDHTVSVVRMHGLYIIVGEVNDGSFSPSYNSQNHYVLHHGILSSDSASLYSE